MSRSEDYLDNLLTSVTDKLSEFDDDFEQNRESLKESYQTKNDLPQKTQSALDDIREENFLREFEDEINKGSTQDDFLSEFERELSGEADMPTQAGPYGDQTVRMEGQTGPYGDQTVRMEDPMGGMEGFVDPSDSLTAQMSGTAGSPSGRGGTPSGHASDDGMDAALEALFQDDAQNPDLPEDGGLQESSLERTLEGEAATTALETPKPERGEDVFSQMAEEQGKSMEAPKGMEGLEDIFGDISDGDMDNLLNELESGVPQAAQEGATIQQETEPVLDDRLEEILNGSDEEALSEIDRLLDTDQENGASDGAPDGDALSMGPDFAYDEPSMEGEGDASKGKKKKEKNKNGLFGKLSRMLFGTPEELDPQAAAEYEAAKAAMGENKELDAKAAKEQKKQEKELKKQQKKEEAEKKKQEKDAAKAEKAAQKASKPKKEKKPKQKNKAPKEPPLPKVPVMMMWILALSMMVLVFLGTSLVGYSVPLSESKQAFESGDYVTAYGKLQGMKVRKADQSLLHASSALAGIQTQLDAYTALMEQKQYEMALDALVRGYGRCTLHSAEAQEWNVSDKLKEFQDKFDLLLKEQFNVSKRKAKKLYKIKKRSDYTLALQEILDGLGLE